MQRIVWKCGNNFMGTLAGHGMDLRGGLKNKVIVDNLGRDCYNGYKYGC